MVSFPLFSIRAAAFCLLAGLLPSFANAQITSGASSAPASISLPGNTLLPGHGHLDLGPAPASTPTGTLELLLQRTPAQDQALHRYLDSLQNPQAATYHKWLTPSQYGALFGAGDSALATVRNWLAAQGFQVESLPASRNFLRFSGTVGQLNRALSISMHRYQVGDTIIVGNTTDPRLPTAIAPLVAAVSPLNSLRATSQQPPLEQSRAMMTASRVLKVTERHAGGTSPQLVEPGAGDTVLYVTPADAATIYDAPNHLNTAYTGTAPQTGTGVNIGIAGYSDLAVSDYLNYRRLFLTETNPPSPTLVVEGADPGVLDQHDGQQTLIGAEIAAATAPGANLYVYSGQSDLMEDGLTDAILRAVEDNTVAVLAVTYSRCEASLGAGGNALFNEMWQQASAQGITVVVAAGDTGSAACDDDSASSAAAGLAVSGFASTPYDLAVGGSDFETLRDHFSQYVHASTASATTAAQSDVTGYIPETAWNDAITNDPPGSLSTNVPAFYSNSQGIEGTILAGGGGGASSVAVCSGAVDPTSGACSGTMGGYPAPAFQSGISLAGAPAGVRLVPDVALFAGTNRQNPAFWAVCSDNAVAQSSSSFVDCSPAADGSFTIEGAGGTATSTAAFSGMLATVIGSLDPGTRLGVANPVLYNLEASSSGATIFHDIVAGNNAMPCAAGALDCGSNGFLSGYNAGPGYDLATGLGSVDMRALVQGWAAVNFAATATTLTVNGGTTPAPVQHGTTVMLAAAVSPTNVAGAVTVNGVDAQGQPLQGGGAVIERIPLTSGAGSIAVHNLPGGNYFLSGYFAGDVTHAPSSSAPPIPITVTPENSIVLFSVEMTDVTTNAVLGSTVPYGSYGFAYAEPRNATIAAAGQDGIATGSVTLTNNGATFQPTLTQAVNSVGNTAFPLAYFAPGVYNLGATYSGDASYNASATAGTTMLTILQAPTQLSIAPASPTVDLSGSLTLTVTLSTDSAGAQPTGPITLSVNGSTYTGTVTASLTAQHADQEIAQILIPGSAFTPGTDTVTAGYAGDTNYLGSTASASVTVTGTLPAAGFTLAGPAGGMTVAATGQTVTGMATVSAIHGFAGTVNLGCTLTAPKYVLAPSCSVTPSVTLAANGSATAMITIGTSAPTSSRRENRLRSPWMEGSGAATLCVVMLWIAPRRRRALHSLLLVLLCAVVLCTVGCGVREFGTTTGTYTATITGTGGAASASTQVTITVQ